MTDQQERMLKEILTTIRTLHRTENIGLTNILSQITNEVLRIKMYKVVMKSISSGENNMKIAIIKIMRTFSNMGLMEAKEIVDKIEADNAPGTILEDLDASTAENVSKSLTEAGLSYDILPM